MSKEKSTKYKYTPTQTLPKLGKIKTEWDLKKHYYTSEKDPQIEKDLKKAERAYEAFAKKYQGKNFTKSAQQLLAALRDYEALVALTAARKPDYYFGYRTTLNAKDSIAEKQENLISQRLTKAGNKIIFFEIAIGKISKTLQKQYLSDKRLAPYRYFLSQVFLESTHTLSEAEERIMSLKATTSSGMWVAGTEKILSNRMVSWRRKEIAIPEALELLDTLASHEKPKLWNILLDEFEQISEVAENEFNAIVTDKKISDELRHYAAPYSRTIQGYENNEKAVLALVKAISTSGFTLSKRFYTLKAKYHGVPKLSYANRNDKIGTPPSIPFEEAAMICRDAFYGINQKYGEIFDEMLINGKIDVYSRAGKRGGAFMSGSIGLPTYVFLNHVDTPSALQTLAHEMGHAIHTERSKAKPPIYQGYSTTTAETASTLFEQIVDNAMLQQANDDQKIILLHDRILRDISTIQRQIAFFNFELDLHTAIRSEGALTKEEMQRLMQKNLKAYLGPAIDVNDRDGLAYVYVPHFRYGFYVYTYAYGILMSKIIAQRYFTGNIDAATIDQFLQAGGSDTVENIFKMIDIDAMKTETFLQSLKLLKTDIDEFERLTKKVK